MTETHASYTRLSEVADTAAKRKLGPSELAALLDESPQSMPNWRKRGVSLSGALKAEAIWGVPALYILGSVDGFEADWVSRDSVIANLSGNPGRKLLDHDVSQSARNIPSLIEWGEKMTEDQPGEFQTRMPDDSMSPRIKAGHILTLDTRLAQSPRPGDAVLVADADNVHRLRIYRERRPGHWEAYALHSDYPEMDSTRDGLRILAVLTAVHGRWG